MQLFGLKSIALAPIDNDRHSFGSALTYALVSANPTISDGIVLTGFTLNSSFTGEFIIGSNFVQANLNQPFRFGNVADPRVLIVGPMLKKGMKSLDVALLQDILVEYDLVDYVAGIETEERVEYVSGYLTDANAGANQFIFFSGHYNPNIVTFAEETKQPITPGELLTLGGAPSISGFEGPVLVIAGCKSTSGSALINEARS